MKLGRAFSIVDDPARRDEARETPRDKFVVSNAVTELRTAELVLASIFHGDFDLDFRCVSG